jgi:tetratricopeptide (TPR) repeat protein
MKMTKSSLVMVIVAVFILLSGQALSGPLPKPNSDNPEAQALIDRAWEIEQSGSSPEIYKQCAEIMEQAAAPDLDPDNASIWTDISRYWWNHGDNLPKETDEQQKKLAKIYEKGLKAAEMSLQIKETVGGHYWYAVNKAASHEFSSIFSQAAAFPTILKHSDYVSEHDPDYYYGASGRLWSEILVRVPKVVVKMVRWDVQEAVDDINDSIEKEPRYLDNYVYKARFIYTYFEDREQALEILEHVLKQNPETLMPGEEKANRVSYEDGKELWKKITGEEYPGK